MPINNNHMRTEIGSVSMKVLCFQKMKLVELVQTTFSIELFADKTGYVRCHQMTHMLAEMLMVTADRPLDRLLVASVHIFVHVRFPLNIFFYQWILPTEWLIQSVSSESPLALFRQRNRWNNKNKQCTVANVCEFNWTKYKTTILQYLKRLKYALWPKQQ